MTVADAQGLVRRILDRDTHGCCLRTLLSRSPIRDYSVVAAHYRADLEKHDDCAAATKALAALTSHERDAFQETL